jgi:predicted aspartyl protease
MGRPTISFSIFFSLSSSSVINSINKKHMKGEHLVIACSLSHHEHKTRTHALTDCGATGYAFIEKEFVSHHNLPIVLLKTPRIVEVIDGRPITSGTITHITKLRLEINQHSEDLIMFITQLGHYPIVLGIS